MKISDKILETEQQMDSLKRLRVYANMLYSIAVTGLLLTIGMLGHGHEYTYWALIAFVPITIAMILNHNTNKHAMTSLLHLKFSLEREKRLVENSVRQS